MNTLKVPLSAIIDRGISIEAVVRGCEHGPEDPEAPSVEAVSVVGTFTEVAGLYIFRGRLAGVFGHLCDRCLERMQAPFDFEVLWEFEAGPAPNALAELGEAAGDIIEDEADAAAVCMFQGDVIDLEPQVWEEVALAAPAKYVCRADCAGLCPHCGANLNRERCACRPEGTIDNKGLAALADLYPDLRPNDLED